MADRVRKVNYCYVIVPHRAGQGIRVLRALAEAKINLGAMVGFPVRGGKAQLDFVGNRLGPIRRVAVRHGWRVSRNKRAFLVQGEDKAGAVHRILRKLADARVSVTATAGVAAGGRRYGMIIWVKPRDYARAARALKAH